MSDVTGILLLRAVLAQYGWEERMGPEVGYKYCRQGTKGPLLNRIHKFVNNHEVDFSENDITEKYITSLKVLKCVLTKATKIVGAQRDMGASVAQQLIDEMQGYKLIKIKDNAISEIKNESPL